MGAFPRLRVGTFIEASPRWKDELRQPYFPAFGRGPSLRQHGHDRIEQDESEFPRLWVGIFVAVLNANREVSRGLRSPGLETRLVSRPGHFVFKT